MVSYIISPSPKLRLAQCLSRFPLPSAPLTLRSKLYSGDLGAE